jgi:hypothetical protein
LTPSLEIIVNPITKPMWRSHKPSCQEHANNRPTTTRNSHPRRRFLAVSPLYQSQRVLSKYYKNIARNPGQFYLRILLRLSLANATFLVIIYLQSSEKGAEGSSVYFVGPSKRPSSAYSNSGHFQSLQPQRFKNDKESRRGCFASMQE